jgi:hypothetical protein
MSLLLKAINTVITAMATSRKKRFLRINFEIETHIFYEYKRGESTFLL